MYNIQKLKLKKDKHYGAIIIQENGQPYGILDLPINKWKQVYTKFYNGLLVNSEHYNIVVFEHNENVIKQVSNIDDKQIIFIDKI